MKNKEQRMQGSCARKTVDLLTQEIVALRNLRGAFIGGIANVNQF